MTRFLWRTLQPSVILLAGYILGYTLGYNDATDRAIAQGVRGNGWDR